jgi:phosphonopyruvate decarboxylase
MIDAADLLTAFRDNGVRFFAGVPDSLLQPFCAHLSEALPSSAHIIAANEGNAIALAAGFHLATGSVGCVYMQNSGLGNAINPLTSLVDSDVYGIPMLLMIGWRAEILEGTQLPDEPQHIKQGRITLDLLECLGIPSVILDAGTEDLAIVIRHAVTQARAEERAVALVVRKNSFKPSDGKPPHSAYCFSREQALAVLLDSLPKDAVLVSTTGKVSRELYEFRTKSAQNSERDFLTVGSMGHALQIATGIALARPDKLVVCIDGDGALIMHMGGLTTSAMASNLIHVVMNNGTHESVGGQPTRGFDIDMEALALACGYRSAWRAASSDELAQSVRAALTKSGARLIEVRISSISRPDLGRPNRSPREAKTGFMQFLETRPVLENT